tara:strand:+ start:22 stop:243 length:222 start_codon:yes stop_codon:yes gene_type:complete
MESKNVVYKVVSKRKDVGSDKGYEITHEYSTGCEAVSNVAETDPAKRIKLFHENMLKYLDNGDMNTIETKVKW